MLRQARIVGVFFESGHGVNGLGPFHVTRMGPKAEGVGDHGGNPLRAPPKPGDPDQCDPSPPVRPSSRQIGRPGTRGHASDRKGRSLPISTRRKSEREPTNHQTSHRCLLASLNRRTAEGEVCVWVGQLEPEDGRGRGVRGDYGLSSQTKFWESEHSSSCHCPESAPQPQFSHIATQSSLPNQPPSLGCCQRQLV